MVAGGDTATAPGGRVQKKWSGRPPQRAQAHKSPIFHGKIDGFQLRFSLENQSIDTKFRISRSWLILLVVLRRFIDIMLYLHVGAVLAYSGMRWWSPKGWLSACFLVKPPHRRDYPPVNQFWPWKSRMPIHLQMILTMWNLSSHVRVLQKNPNIKSRYFG